MADTDILRAIKIIDAKIASLKDARDRLASAFGVADSGVFRSPVAPLRTPNNSQGLTPSTNRGVTQGYGHPKGRKGQLAQYLLEHGPALRTDITAMSGLPEGTVSYCLNDERFFEQLEDGRWNLTEFSKRGLEQLAEVARPDGEEEN